MHSDEVMDKDPHPHRRIWHIALPAIIANISGPLVGIVDTWALGQLGDARMLAAIAIGAFIFHFVYWSFGFLRMGTTGLIAQAHGAGDTQGLMRILMRSGVLGLFFAFSVILVQGPLLSGLFAFLKPDATEAALALSYCQIRIWGAPAILLRLTVIGSLVGTQRTRLALVIELVLNLSNAALTVYLVRVLGWGIEGAAVASLAAEIVAVLLAIFVIIRLYGMVPLVRTVRQAGFWRAGAFGKLLRVNGFLFVRTLFLLLAFGLLWRTSAGLGTQTLAANQVLIQFLMITSFGLDGIAYAAEALVGAAFGRQSRSYMRQMVILSSAWALLLAVLYSAAFALFGETIIAAFTTVEAVRTHASLHLPWLIAIPVIGVWSYQLDGIFIGATRTAVMMWTMVLSFLLYGLALFLFVPPYGNHGLWGALMLFLGVRGLSLGLFLPRLIKSIPNKYGLLQTETI